jgi:hypothetical protein
MNFMAMVVFWAALAAVTLGLAVYRKTLASHEDPGIHLSPGGETVDAGQVALAGKIGAIDKWGKILTVLTIIVGVVIGALYGYEAFHSLP